MSRHTAAQTRPKSGPPQVSRRIVQRKCACGQHVQAGAECAECKTKRMNSQRRPPFQGGDRGEGRLAPPIVHDALRSLGRPLDPATRALMEPGFGHDFSQVRVHTDGKAVESARALNALAYTVGQDLVFGTGQYAPGTRTGKQLLAHELAHVVQQAYGGSGCSQPEQRAETAAAGVMRGGTIAPASLGGAGRSVQRKPDKPPDKSAKETPKADPDSWSRTLDGFGLNSAVLSGGHNKVIEMLAAEISSRVGLKADAKATITISGYTDTSGDEKYNQDLGLSRANVAKTALEEALKKRKVAGDRIAGITPRSFGERELAVETADNVKEPLNRRVVLTVKVEGPPPSSVPSPDRDPSEVKKPTDWTRIPEEYSVQDVPEEDWWTRTQREIDKIKEYDRKHPRKPKSLTDVLVEGVIRALDPIIKKLPENLRKGAREGLRKGIEAGTEKACEAAVDASGVTGESAEAMKTACKAALKTKPGEKR